MLLTLKVFINKMKDWYKGEKVYELDLGSFYENPNQLLYKQTYTLERHWSSNLVHKIISYIKYNHLTILAILVSIFLYFKA